MSDAVGLTRAAKLYEARRAERRRHQSDPGDLGWIIVCAIDGGPFVPLNPSWEYDSEAHAIGGGPPELSGAVGTMIEAF